MTYTTIEQITPVYYGKTRHLKVDKFLILKEFVQFKDDIKQSPTRV